MLGVHLEKVLVGVHLHFHDDRQLLGTKKDELFQSLGETLKLWVSFALVGTLCLHYSLVEAGRSHHQAGEVVDGEVEEPGILHHRLENLHLLHFWILHPLLGIQDQDVLLPTSTQLFGFAPDVGKKVDKHVEKRYSNPKKTLATIVRSLMIVCS